MHSSVVGSLILFVFAAQGRSSSEDQEAVSIRGEDALLPCLVEAEPGVRYRAVTWYKVSEAPSDQLTGLVMKRLTPNNGSTQRYKGLMRDVELLGDSQSLLLPHVSLQDAGRYLCFLSAPVGHQNKQREIYLRVFDDVSRDDNSDTLYLVLAIVLLLAALLMFSVSYVCLRSTLMSHKDKFSNVSRLKTTHKMKNLIVSLKPKGVVSRISAVEYV